MNLNELMDENLLNEMIAQKFVKVASHPQEAGLRILHYTDKAVYDKVWNEVTEQCRGLIVAQSGEVVARPWRKFFNYGERTIEIGSHDPVEITDKMDGSLGIVYWAKVKDKFELQVSTKGSFVSEQALWATNWLKYNFKEWNPEDICAQGLTILVEIIYPNNKIICDYGSFEGLVLLGAVDMNTGWYYGPAETAGMTAWPGVINQVLPYKTMADYLSSSDTNRENAEGVVIRAGNKMIKLKQNSYVRAHALVSKLSNVHVWEILSKGDSLPDKAAFMPDEFHEWIIRTAEDLSRKKIAWASDAYEDYFRIMNNLNFTYQDVPITRKMFATLVAKHPKRSALFKLYDGASIEELAWKAVRPIECKSPLDREEKEKQRHGTWFG